MHLRCDAELLDRGWLRLGNRIRNGFREAHVLFQSFSPFILCAESWQFFLLQLVDQLLVIHLINLSLLFGLLPGPHLLRLAYKALFVG